MYVCVCGRKSHVGPSVAAQRTKNPWLAQPFDHQQAVASDKRGHPPSPRIPAFPPWRWLATPISASLSSTHSARIPSFAVCVCLAQRARQAARMLNSPARHESNAFPSRFAFLSTSAAMERTGIACATPVISLQKLKNFLTQPRFRFPHHGEYDQTTQIITTGATTRYFSEARGLPPRGCASILRCRKG